MNWWSVAPLNGSGGPGAPTESNIACQDWRGAEAQIQNTDSALRFLESVIGLMVMHCAHEPCETLMHMH